jgi:hypothetical protein
VRREMAVRSIHRPQSALFFIYFTPGGDILSLRYAWLCRKMSVTVERLFGKPAFFAMSGLCPKGKLGRVADEF